jgi:RNA polymerase sigma-70 factor (ECF subfamily)
MSVMTGEVADRVPLDPPRASVASGEPPDARIAALFDAHHRRLYSLARRMSRSVEEARDLVQDTFLRVAMAPGRVPHGPRSEEAWLVRVLINLCRDRWRRAATREKHVDDLPLPPAAVDPERALVAHSIVWRALVQLSPRRRAIVVMHELEELSPADIAGLLGVATVTVRWHLSRGRLELARIVREQEEP